MASMKPLLIPVHIISLGCAKNLVDTEVMAGSLAQAGFVLTADPEQAAVQLVNTCSFIADARAEAEAELGGALAWKRADPTRRKVVVTGCLPQRDLPALRKRHPDADLLLGLDEVPRIAEHLTALFRAKAGKPAAPAAASPALPTWIYNEDSPRLLLTPRAYAYVKIAEGCDHGCRFCAIPAIRGRQRSRSLASIVTECRRLLDMGVRELNLIAQDTSAYGRDRKDGATLAALLGELDRLKGDFWIRVLYTHPRHLTGDLIEVLATAKHAVPYLDMPLQHIADHVLKDMGRRMSGAETRELLAQLRRRLPGLTFRTTLLVGYPGETEADFAELLTFVREFRFDRLGVFAYSPEDGTPAAKLRTGLVPVEIAHRRRDALMAAQQKIAAAATRKLVGRTLRVIFDHAESARRWVGRTAADAPEVDNIVRVQGVPPAGDCAFAEVSVTAASPYELTAVPVKSSGNEEPRPTGRGIRQPNPKHQSIRHSV